GQEPPRRWAEPVSLADVARASVSEIEQYDRVVLDIQPGLGVTGNAVADIVHLLAEVIENATTFSAKNTQVTVSGPAPRNGGGVVSVGDVARGSVSEIAQYDRVVLDIQPGLGVTGNAVADIVHLLAEVIENATTFSAKNTQVTVSGHALRSGGVLINVVDNGMG